MEFDDENYADYNTPQVNQEHSDEVYTPEHTSSESEESNLLSIDHRDIRTHSDKDHSTQLQGSRIDHNSIDASVDNSINGHNITGFKDMGREDKDNVLGENNLPDPEITTDASTADIIMDSDASSELDGENLDKSQSIDHLMPIHDIEIEDGEYHVASPLKNGRVIELSMNGIASMKDQSTTAESYITIQTQDTELDGSGQATQIHEASKVYIYDKTRM